MLKYEAPRSKMLNLTTGITLCYPTHLEFKAFHVQPWLFYINRDCWVEEPLERQETSSQTKGITFTLIVVGTTSVCIP